MASRDCSADACTLRGDQPGEMAPSHACVSACAALLAALALSLCLMPPMVVAQQQSTVTLGEWRLRTCNRRQHHSAAHCSRHACPRSPCWLRFASTDCLPAMHCSLPTVSRRFAGQLERALPAVWHAQRQWHRLLHPLQAGPCPLQLPRHVRRQCDAVEHHRQRPGPGERRVSEPRCIWAVPWCALCSCYVYVLCKVVLHMEAQLAAPQAPHQLSHGSLPSTSHQLPPQLVPQLAFVVTRNHCPKPCTEFGQTRCLPTHVPAQRHCHQPAQVQAEHHLRHGPDR